MKGVFGFSVLALWAMFGALNSANAAFKVEFQDQTGAVVTITAIDNVLNDLNPNPNIIRFVGQVGDFSIDATVATTNSPGTGVLASVGMSSGSVINTAATTQVLQIFTTSTDFIAPSPPVTVNSSGSITVNGLSPGNVNMDFTSYIDGSNAEFGTAIATATITNNAAPGTSASGNAPSLKVNVLGSPYSVSNKAVYTFGGSGFVDGSSGTTNVRPVVPGPGGLALALAGMPFFGMAWLRRRSK